nr:hypothetical protein [uncultured Janthinobacterium sp.]
MKKMLLSLFALSLLSACASSPMPAGTPGNQLAYEENEAVTGSNIKKRVRKGHDVLSVISKDEVDDYRQQMPAQPAARGF